MLKVFISSTSRDLYLHRKALITAIHEAGHHAIAMEHFGAQAGDATTVSVQEVEQADIFIGIYARRYGYCPEDDKSVTELEFIAAKNFKIDRLIFIVDDNYHDELLDKYADTDPALIVKLEKFKERLTQSYVRALFTTPEDLSTKVLAALMRGNQGGNSNPNSGPVNDYSRRIEGDVIDNKGQIIFGDNNN